MRNHNANKHFATSKRGAQQKGAALELEGMCVSVCRVEYCTWAGMIVTQYGRFPGSHATNGVLYNSAQGGSPPRQSAALDQLQRYYGTGDTCSEPGDFKPGSSPWLAPTFSSMPAW